MKYNATIAFVKGTIIYMVLLGAMFAVVLMSGCSDKEVPLPRLKDDATYTSSTLELYYQGDIMPGKQATLHYEYADAAGINASGNVPATLTFSQVVDLSSISGLGLSGKIQGPGPAPGSAVLQLPVTLVPSDGAYLMSGSSETDYLTFDYSGKLEADKLTFSFSNCKLKSDVYAGKIFAPAPIEKSGLADYTSLPFHLVWELDPALGVDIPLSDILKLIAAAPIVPVYNGTAYSSLAQLFCSAVQTIALADAGNMPVVYISEVGGAAHIATTSPNMLQYVPAPGGMKVFINPLSVFGEFLVATSNNKDNVGFDFDKLLSRASVGDDGSGELTSGMEPAMTKALLEVLLTSLAPQIRDGVPLSMTVEEKGVAIYFDTQTSVQFLTDLLQTAMKNPEIMQTLQAYLAKVDLPGLDPAKLQTLLQSLPTCLEHTTRLEIGLSLINYSGK